MQGPCEEDRRACARRGGYERRRNLADWEDEGSVRPVIRFEVVLEVVNGVASSVCDIYLELSSEVSPHV